MATKQKIIRQKSALKRRNSEALEWLEEETKAKDSYHKAYCLSAAKLALEEVKSLKASLGL